MTKKLTDLKTLRTSLAQELEQYKSCDPQVLKELKQQTVVAHEAANRWTGTVCVYK